METRVCVCPYCKSSNSRALVRLGKIGSAEMKKLFPDSDESDYVLLKQICDSCTRYFYTKAKIKIEYADNRDIILTDIEAKYLGIMH